jgi:hypothetical protein
MIRSTEQQLSEEDAQLIEANDLGSPFAIFKINPMYISFMYFLFFLLVIFFLIFASAGLIYVIGPNWQGSDIDYLSLALVAVMIASCLFGVIFILRVALPEAQKQRIIVCEQGLLEVKETLRGRKIAVVDWQDVRRIQRLYGEYLIKQRGGEAFSLDILY